MKTQGTLFLVLFLISFALFAQNTNTPKIEKGMLDLRSWKMGEQKIALTGNWIFYENEIIDKNDSTIRTEVLSHFPEIWKKEVQYGTYKLNVLVQQDLKKFALEIPQLYSSYNIWINGELIAKNGTPGTTKETTTPQWMPQTVSFNHKGDTLTIIIQIANFYHNIGGAKESIYLGNAEILQQHHIVSVNSTVIEAITLAVLGFVFFAIYYIREERKKITFYFSLLCFSWSIRALFSNNYLFISSFPTFNWTLMVKIEYIMLYATMIWGILFLSRLFPKESIKLIKFILVGMNCFFIIITAVFSPLIFTKYLSVYLGVAGILLLFGVVIVIRALVNERSGVWLLVACLILGISLFSYDIFVYESILEFYNAALFSIGYIAMFSILGISLLYHLKIFKGDGSSNWLTYEDLYGKK